MCISIKISIENTFHTYTNIKYPSLFIFILQEFSDKFLTIWNVHEVFSQPPTHWLYWDHCGYRRDIRAKGGGESAGIILHVIHFVAEEQTETHGGW